jgi:metal-sulfur cluster biosynthetic enzyme
MINITGKNAPSTSVVIPHFVYGAISLLSSVILIIIRPDAFTSHFFNYGLLSITHLLVLGWITMVILGALYQLLPVIIEASLYSESIARINFYLLGVGILLLATAFWNGWMGSFLILAGGIILLAVLLFSLNIYLTVRGLKIRSMEFLFIGTSIIWLIITVLAGLLGAINLMWPFLDISHLQWLKLHAHAGIVGWFLLLVIGVASRLFPMFLVVENVNKTTLRISYFFINAGLLSGLLASYYHWIPGIVSAVALGLTGIASFLVFVSRVFVRRMKKQLDTGMRQTAVAFYFLLAAILLLLVSVWGGVAAFEANGVAIAYMSCVVIGFFTSLVMGQTYKTLPFIIWLKNYQGRVGKEKTPMPRELYAEWAAQSQVIIFSLAFLGFLGGILFKDQQVVRLAGILLGASVALYCYNVFKIVTHRPKGVDLTRVKDKTQHINKLLRQVIDPELQVNIMDLGLVYGVNVDHENKLIHIEMTLSSKACPLGDAIIENVEQVVKSGLPEYLVDIQLVWEPLWSTKMVTEEGRKQLAGIS